MQLLKDHERTVLNNESIIFIRSTRHHVFLVIMRLRSVDVILSVIIAALILYLCTFTYFFALFKGFPTFL